MTPVGSVDVGSNTVRLMVGIPTDTGSFTVADRAQVITRLGEGMGNSRILYGRAIDRTVRALSGFRKRWEGLGVRRYRAVATSAVREADNRDEFIAAAASEGVTVEVISGIEEARLVIAGISPTAPAARDRCVTIDIGGGSTEFILTRDGEVKDIVSTDLGVVRLTELFLTVDPPLQEELGRLSYFVEKRIDMVYNRFHILGASPIPYRLIGTAGTVTTLAAVDRGLVAYDPDLVEGYVLGYGSIARMLLDFLASTGDQRLAKYSVLTRGRQDVIVAGTLILRIAMERLGLREVMVSDRGLLEGITEGLIGSP